MTVLLLFVSFFGSVYSFLFCFSLVFLVCLLHFFFFWFLVWGGGEGVGGEGFE